MAFKRSSSGTPFTLPMLVMIVAVLVIPLAATVALSFRGEGGFGFEQYLRLVRSEEARHSFWVTFEFTFISVAGHLVVGLFAAQLLHTRLWLPRLWRILILVPWIISPVICGVIWRWLLDPLYGLVNQWLQGLGLVAQPVLWLENPALAMLSVILAWIWTGFPFVMVILLAGLQQIDEEQYEAAKVDGANILQRFWHVTLPNLRMVILIASLLDTIQSFRAFSSVYVMTNGGPGNSTNIVSIFVYKQAFEYFKFEFASATGIGMALVLLVAGFVYLKALGEEVR